VPVCNGIRLSGSRARRSVQLSVMPRKNRNNMMSRSVERKGLLGFDLCATLQVQGENDGMHDL
jgi:hypothetical protein